MRLRLKPAILLICLIATYLCFMDTAIAHRLNVFAWQENGKILVECNFGKKSPARNALVQVMTGDTQKTVAQGKTNDKGLFTFEIPSEASGGLLIRADAGEGHQNQWKMDDAEFTGVSKNLAIPHPASTQIADTGHTSHINSPQTGKEYVPLEAVCAIVHAELEQQLAPIRRQLAEQAGQGPGLVEIFGGIGWILGLGAMYVFGRSIRGRQI